MHAFGAYSTKKGAARNWVPIENEAYTTRLGVHFWRGPFYVRVTGGPEGTVEALTRLASAVAARMPPAPDRPAALDWFPVEGRIPHSERYSVEPGFGQAFFASSFQAGFDGGGDAIEGLIVPSQGRPDAVKILDAYRALYARNGRVLDSIANLGEDNFTGEDRYLGRTVAFRTDRFVVAFRGYGDRHRLADLALATAARMRNPAPTVPSTAAGEPHFAVP